MSGRSNLSSAAMTEDAKAIHTRKRTPWMKCVLVEITQKRSETAELRRRLLLSLALLLFVFTVAFQKMVETGFLLGTGFRNRRERWW